MKIELLGYEIVIRKKVIPPPPAPVNPPKKPKKPRIQKCLVMDKRMFTREQAAVEAKATKAPNIRFYCCEFCNTWHLTHKKNKLNKH